MSIETFHRELPHGISLSVRAAGEPGRPVLMFLHGFPEAAFIWDAFLLHFARPENGGYRCVAPNLRGFEASSAPTDVAAYRPKHLVRDIQALAVSEGAPLAMLVAHDWGGAVAWNVANQHPELLRRLSIINSPHPGTFLRALQHSPAQQAASQYMNFLVRPDAEALLRADGYARLLGMLRRGSTESSWLTPELEQRYTQVWDQSLTGGCNYYRASPLRPPSAAGPGANAIELPQDMLTVRVPTQVIWGMDDQALLPELLDGLDTYVDQLRVLRVPGASHWIVHERPAWVTQQLAEFLS